LCKSCKEENIVHQENIYKIPVNKIQFYLTFRCQECNGENTLLKMSMLLENEFGKLQGMKPEKESFPYYFRKVLLRTTRMQIKE